MSSNAGPTTLHTLDIAPLSRGEVLYLFLTDAGIRFKEVRYALDDTWPSTSEKLVKDGLTRSGKLPVLEYKGLVFSQHVPIMNFLARELGSYDGATSVEKFTVAAVADIYIDWRAEWVKNLSGATEEYKASVPNYYKLVGQYYSETCGPYLLGDRITYADFLVYHSIDNDRRIGGLPTSIPVSLQKLVEAMEARPNIYGYIKTHKQQ